MYLVQVKYLSMALASLLAFSVNAQAPSDGVKLGTTTETTISPVFDVMYSPATIKSGDLVTVKVFGTYPKADDFGIRSMLSEVQFDCQANQLSITKISAYAEPNQTGKSENFPPEMLNEFQKLSVDKVDKTMTVGILPFSMVANLKAAVCGGSTTASAPDNTPTTLAPSTLAPTTLAPSTPPSRSSTAQNTVPAPAPGANAVADSSLCKVGMKSKFFWATDKKWYDGTVIDVKSDACRVHYHGYSKEDDAWVTPENMRLLVLWKDGKQYPAQVVRKQGPGKYLVKYDGYDSSSNEVVDLAQL